MEGTIDKLVIKFCENLPLDGTFFERDTKCTKNTDICDYSKQLTKDIYLCNKKTLTSTGQPGFSICYN